MGNHNYGGDRVPEENKIKPVTSFTIFSPHKYSISCTKKQFEDFKIVTEKKKIKPTHLFQKWFFDLFGVKNMFDLIQENFIKNSIKTKNPLYRREVAKAHLAERNALDDESGLTKSELSTYFRDKMENYIKSDGRKK